MSLVIVHCGPPRAAPPWRRLLRAWLLGGQALDRTFPALPVPREAGAERPEPEEPGRKDEDNASPSTGTLTLGPTLIITESEHSVTKRTRSLTLEAGYRGLPQGARWGRSDERPISQEAGGHDHHQFSTAAQFSASHPVWT
jgi:hypothetical protein